MLQTAGKMVSFPAELSSVSSAFGIVPPIFILALFANTAESRILALTVNAQEPAATAPLLDNVLGQESIDSLKKGWKLFTILSATDLVV